MAAWKVVMLAVKARQGWKRIPPKQRRAMLEAAQRNARTHGPTMARKVREHGPVVAKKVREHGPDVARRVTSAVRQPRKPG